jgi:hypothetical protein
MGGHLKNSAGSHRAPALADASSTQFSFFFSSSSSSFDNTTTHHTHTRDEPLVPSGQLEKLSLEEEKE